jgi:hypothetical protein
MDQIGVVLNPEPGPAQPEQTVFELRDGGYAQVSKPSGSFAAGRSRGELARPAG